MTQQPQPRVMSHWADVTYLWMPLEIRRVVDHLENHGFHTWISAVPLSSGFPGVACL